MHISRAYYAVVIATVFLLVLGLGVFPRPNVEAAPVRAPESGDEEKTFEAEDELLELLAAPADADAIDDDAPEVRYLRGQYGFSADEAKQDVARQPALIALIELFKRRNPGTFGGAWISHKEGGRLHLAATQWTVDDQAFVLEQVPGAEDLIEFETVEHTLDTLVDAYNRGAGEQSELQAGGYP